MRDGTSDKDASTGAGQAGCLSTSAKGPWRPLILSGLLVVGSFVAMPVDPAVRDWVAATNWPAPFARLLLLTECFAHGLGILVIGLLVFQLDPVRRWSVPRLLLVALGSGIVADMIKVSVARVRSSRADLAGSVWDVVQGWFHAGAGLQGQRFPSGHAAAAFGLAFALSAFYPRGRWTFFALALLATFQRLHEHAHDLSDVLFGAAIGCLIAAICLYRSPVAALFDRREALWRSWAGR
jgi:membrane-associated phospholipid phosphatase